MTLAGTQARRARSLYVHVPFCLSVCPYCDFVVYGGRAATEDGLLDAFVRAVLRELELRVGEDALGCVSLETVYLGGGTPSLLGPRRVAGLLDGVARRAGIARHAEVTLEVNPGPRDRGDLRGAAAAGVTRLSIGAQSLVTAELRHLGRRHVPRDVAVTLRQARRAGIASVSVDLLYDVPGQTLASWGRTLDGTVALEPDHVSAYALTLDDPDAEGLTGPLGDHLPVRPGARRWRERARRAQDAEGAPAMYELADGRLASAGLEWYELSNWARPGHHSRHNLVYWRRRRYLALGPGAHGFDGTRRWWNAARLDAYLAALLPPRGVPPALPPGGGEDVTGRARRSERAFLGLRLAEGLDERSLRALRRDRTIREALTWGVGEGLLRHDGRLALTMRGRLLADEVFVRLV